MVGSGAEYFKMAGIQQPESKQLRHALENIIQNTSLATTTSGTVGSGQNVILTTTVSSNAGAEIMSNLDISIYQDSVSGANLFPGGSNVALGDWIFMGPYSDYNSNNNLNQVYKTVLINVSAGNHTIIFKTLLRVIQNTISTVSLQA